MEFGKVRKQIFNPVSENVKKLAELFPSAVKDGQVDIEALKSELGEFEAASEKLSERYELGWAGKENAKRYASTDIIGRTLKYVPEESKNPETTENLYIEGDNLEVLKLLRNSYYNKIKMIYIDPPYNTGNDFVYRDDFSISEKENAVAEGEIDEYGERLIVNQKSSGRYHSNWLSMMYPRLRVAKDLLTDDGVIFISSDDNEVENLKKLCNEIFGEINNVGTIANVNNPKGRSDDKYIATAHEYMLVYAKSVANLRWYGFEPTEQIVKRYNKVEPTGRKYREIDLRKTGENDLREDRPNLFYYFYYNKATGDFYPSRENKKMSGYIQIKPQREDGREGNWRWGLETAQKSINTLIPKFMPSRKVWGVMEKDYLDNRSLVKPTSAWTFKDVNSERGSEDFINLGFDKRVFPKPKPLGSILRSLKLATASDDIVLDFFSGSATTAHAVMQLNAEDGGSRKFIMVQIPEPCDEKSEAYKAGFKNVSEIGKERIRRAGEKIKKEYKGKKGIENLDIGFKVFKVADTNIRWFSEAIKSDELTFEESMMSDKDKLDFNPGFTDIDVVYEILLRHRNIPLSANVEKLSSIGDRTYIFADTVVVCLEEKITEKIIDKIAAIEAMPAKIIFRDSAFDADISLKTNSMLRLEAQMKKNSGDEKKVYRVEFI